MHRTVAIIPMLLLAACKPSATSSDNRSSVNQVLKLPQGSGEIVNPPVDSSIVLSDPFIEGVPHDHTIELFQGVTATVSYDFATERANIAGGGLRFGKTGPISFIPLRGVYGRTEGRVRFWFAAAETFCENFSGPDAEPCRELDLQTFAVTERGAVSLPYVTPAVLFCGTCEDPNCQGIVPSCPQNTGFDGGTHTVGADAQSEDPGCRFGETDCEAGFICSPEGQCVPDTG